MEISQIFKRLALNEETDRQTFKTYLLDCGLISQEKYEIDDYNLEALELLEADIELLESFKDNIISNDNEKTKMLEQFKTMREANPNDSIQEVIKKVLSTGKAKETSPDASSNTDQNKKRRSIVQISKDFKVTLSEIDYSLSHLKLETQNSYSYEQAQSIYNSIVEKRRTTPNQTAKTTETAQPEAELNLDDLQPLVKEGALQLKKDILDGILQENQAVTRNVISAYRHGVLASLSDPNFVVQVRDAASRESLRLNAAKTHIAAINGTPRGADLEAEFKDVTSESENQEAPAEEIKPENKEAGV
jgi:hypothetical protein